MPLSHLRVRRDVRRPRGTDSRSLLRSDGRSLATAGFSLAHKFRQGLLEWLASSLLLDTCKAVRARLSAFFDVNFVLHLRCFFLRLSSCAIRARLSGSSSASFASCSNLANCVKNRFGVVTHFLMQWQSLLQLLRLEFPHLLPLPLHSCFLVLRWKRGGLQCMLQGQPTANSSKWLLECDCQYTKRSWAAASGCSASTGCHRKNVLSSKSSKAEILQLYMAAQINISNAPRKQQ